jgi:hypothetical protein
VFAPFRTVFNTVLDRAVHHIDEHPSLCASLDGFTSQAAARAGALHLTGQDALRRYVLRVPIAQPRLERLPVRQAG